MVHYSIIDRAMQAFSFKTGVDDETRDVFELYMKTLEGLMWERAKKNAKFAMQLSDLDNYPMFFTIEQPLSAIIAMHQMPMQQDPLQGGADTTKVKTGQEQ
jgi:hypothetical protein